MVVKSIEEKMKSQETVITSKHKKIENFQHRQNHLLQEKLKDAEAKIQKTDDGCVDCKLVVCARAPFCVVYVTRIAWLNVKVPASSLFTQIWTKTRSIRDSYFDDTS